MGDRDDRNERMLTAFVIVGLLTMMFLGAFLLVASV
jgi:hypothetical protein